MPPRRRSRLGLYLPFLALLALAVAWSIGWFVIRERTRAGLDEWISAEAVAGRRWSCADRTIGGYPFRIEIGCSNFTLDRPDVHASIGRLLVVNQIYNPRHVIAEASGPFDVTAGDIRGQGAWKLLQASVIATDGGFERISLVVENPSASIGGGTTDALDLSSRHFEAHLRPDPARADTFDFVAESRGAVIPGLDALVGGTEPADLGLSLALTQSRDLPARPLLSELERWRAAGGIVDLGRFTLSKGPRRAEAKGQVGLDEAHRVAATIDLSAAGLGGVLGRLAGGSGVGGLLGALLGAPPPDRLAGPQDAPAVLKPLPQIRLAGGRLYFGPLAIPGVRLMPLY